MRRTAAFCSAVRICSACSEYFFKQGDQSAVAHWLSSIAVSDVTRSRFNRWNVMSCDAGEVPPLETPFSVTGGIEIGRGNMDDDAGSEAVLTAANGFGRSGLSEADESAFAVRRLTLTIRRVEISAPVDSLYSGSSSSASGLSLLICFSASRFPIGADYAIPDPRPDRYHILENARGVSPMSDSAYLHEQDSERDVWHEGQTTLFMNNSSELDRQMGALRYAAL